MKQLVLNPLTRRQAEAFVGRPAHALLLAGPTGSGKRTLAVSLSELVLGLSAGSFAAHPYALLVEPEEGKAIGIDAVRQLERFLALKVPGQTIATVFDRAVIIDGAHLMTPEAQNALLKILEEPPSGTVIVLTAGHEQALLPTIRSRVQLMPIGRLKAADLQAHFGDQGFDKAAVQRAYAISGGLPGLMHALLHDAEHPLIEATERARQLLSQTVFERLTAVDELAKQRPLAIDVTLILQQMAHLSLQAASGPAARRWQRILTAAYAANQALTGSAQPKLALTSLMLSL